MHVVYLSYPSVRIVSRIFWRKILAKPLLAFHACQRKKRRREIIFLKNRASLFTLKVGLVCCLRIYLTYLYMSYTKNIMLAGIAALVVTTSWFTAFADENMSGETSVTSTALPTSTGANTQTPTANSTKRGTFDFKKILPAMQAREDAIALSWVKEYEAKQAALLNRRASLTSAYNLTDNKAVRSAVREAHKAYYDAITLARKNSRAERKAAWDTFNNAVKALRVPTTSRVEGVSESSKDQE